MKVTRLEGASINVATYTDDDGTVTSRELVMTVTAQVPLLGPGGQPVVGIVELEHVVLPLGRNPQNGRLASDDLVLLLRGEELPPDVQVAPAALLDHLGRNGQPRP